MIALARARDANHQVNVWDLGLHLATAIVG
jgi:hypothetical protein